MKKSSFVMYAGLFALWIGGTQARAQQAPTQQAQPAQAQGRGRGGRGGSGRGGGQQQDPFLGADLTPKPPVLPQSVESEQEHFVLPSGYRMTNVLHEPDIMEPMQVAFDGNGRMFVLEMRSYGQDVDFSNEDQPISRISLHEDTKGTGVYDKHTVFVDHLIAPRFVLPYGPNSILTMETNGDDVYLYTDTNGDGVADKKELFTSDFGRSGNLEHQQATLFYALDNWLYSTVNAFRVRQTAGGVKRETVGSNGAQWGVSQNNYGKLYFQGGASGLPAYFQFPIEYGNFTYQDLDPGLRVPYGAAMHIADMQGGMGVIRMPDGSLNSTTAGAGNNIYRGDRLPKELQGDYFYGEVVARVVRRLRETNKEGLSTLRNVYEDEHDEFLKGTDPLFRPVYTTNAPDGTMYVVDPYRGIIQEGTWVNPGSYLRAKVQQYQLDKVTNHGRIWRLTYDGMDRDKTMPHMNNETAAQLITHLNHPNGWWRDTAQRLLVLKGDKSVAPQLIAMAKTNPNQLARIHAIWTLEGLNSLDSTTARLLMKDPDPQIRIQAIRASETLYKAGDRTLQADYRSATKDPDANVAIQALLTEKIFKPEDLPAIIQDARDANKAEGVQLVGEQILHPVQGGRGGGGGRGGPRLSAAQQEVMAKGEAVYKEVCFSCHGDDGRGEPIAEKGGATKAPPLAGSPRVQGHRDYVLKAVMYGLKGNIDGKIYNEVMVPNGGNKDEWISSVVSYVRNSFGNTGDFATVGDVARIRAANPGRRVKQDKSESATAPNTRFTIPELLASIPKPLSTQGAWKASASENNDKAVGGLGFLGWRTSGSQKPGTWYQVELPAATLITELQFESAGAGGGGGGGGGGRGGRGASGGGGRGVVAPPDPALAGDAPPVAPAGAPAFGGPGGPGGPPPTPNSPIEYKVQVSLDGNTWSDSVAEGKGGGASTDITFKSVRAKFIRITQTGSADNATPWAVTRLRVFAAPAPIVAAKPAAPAAPKTTAQK